MSKNEILARIAAIITTLAETNGTPESQLYILFNMDMAAFSLARQVMLDTNLITIKGNWVTLTEIGHRKAEALNALVR